MNLTELRKAARWMIFLLEECALRSTNPVNSDTAYQYIERIQTALHNQRWMELARMLGDYDKFIRSSNTYEAIITMLNEDRYRMGNAHEQDFDDETQDGENDQDWYDEEV